MHLDTNKRRTYLTIGAAFTPSTVYVVGATLRNVHRHDAHLDYNYVRIYYVLIARQVYERIIPEITMERMNAIFHFRFTGG